MFAATVAKEASSISISLPNPGSFLGSINWTAPSWDLFIFVFLIGATILYGFSLGKSRLAAILVSTYISLAVVTNLPYVGVLSQFVSGGRFFALRTLTFLGIFIVLFFLLSRSQFLRSIVQESSGDWWRVGLFSLLHVGLLTSIILSFLPADVIGCLGGLTQTVFTRSAGRLFWLVGPLLAMIWTRWE